MMDEFTSGAGFWIRGWRYNLCQPKLLFLCLVPLFLSLLLIVPLLWILFAELPDWSRELAGLFMGWSFQFWQDVIFYPLMLSAGLAIFIGSLFCFYILHSLLAIPFYAVLADRVVASLGKKPARSASFVRMLRAGVVKTCILLPTGAGLFVCSFLPGLNLLAIAGAMLILAFDVMDYSFESVGFGFRQRVKYLLQHRAQWLGMAVGLALTLPIPALTLLVIPGAVTGGALILKVNHEQ